MSSLCLKFPLRPLAVLFMSLSLGACTLGPDYQRPELPLPGEFRQAEGWKPATPADHFLGEPWWQLYEDAELNALVERLNVSNQNLAAAEAQYRQARALVRGARAGFFPSLSGNVGKTRSGRGTDSSTTTVDGYAVSSSGGGGISQSYDLNLAASWELDLWGRLRRGLESSRATMQASAADLAAVRLSLQSELVQNYLQLRVLDAEKRLLEATVQAYERSLRVSENQYRAGIVPRSDVSQATAQLRSAQAQAIDLQYQRAQLEHAIAVLIGVAPSELRVAEVAGIPRLPEVPALLPSHLLERRPDVAAAEREVMSANAEIGVAKTAWFPSLSLSAAGGYRSGTLDNWIQTPNRFWSIGPEFAMTLFDGGLIRSRIEQAEASYDQTVAGYRQTVLDSFREVEDSLVQLRVLGEEAQVQREALEAAQESLRLIENQYRAGTVDFLSVVTVQTTALNNERTSLNLLCSRLLSSVQLVTALGGGWHSQQLAEEPVMATEQ
ncbi:efflux transporter outer membrane subunit [Pseudomonas saudiphocaensis]|uniref:efflux transporter outer membrane subunit n=1 Tax=Pseudomonas saudiphocaensis TaxID=1499686 RepID=UPI000F79246A|nr:efflux transporter outer membrane subunit [Pseudomonas saudiphocaensis]RRV16901.1 efflux transporter outer membrane subunit [Pseudomonas saudiphocaensis]